MDTEEPARSPELPDDLVKGVTNLDENGTADGFLSDSMAVSVSSW